MKCRKIIVGLFIIMLSFLFSYTVYATDLEIGNNADSFKNGTSAKTVSTELAASHLAWFQKLAESGWSDTSLPTLTVKYELKAKNRNVDKQTSSAESTMALLSADPDSLFESPDGDYNISSMTISFNAGEGKDYTIKCSGSSTQLSNGKKIMDVLSSGAFEGIIAGSIEQGFNIGIPYSLSQRPISDLMEMKGGGYEFKAISTIAYSFGYFYHPIFGPMYLNKDPLLPTMEAEKGVNHDKAWLDYMKAKRGDIVSGGKLKIESNFPDFANNLSDENVNMEGCKITDVKIENGVKRYSAVSGSKDPRNVLSYNVPMAVPYVFSVKNGTAKLGMSNLRQIEGYIYCLYNDVIYNDAMERQASMEYEVGVPRENIYLYYHNVASNGSDDSSSSSSSDNTSNSSDTSSSSSGGVAGDKLVETVKKYLGVPYVWGGASPSGFDCSGLMQYVCNENGISSLKHNAQEQYDSISTKVEKEDLQPGDLVFFGAGDESVTHVGMYIGNGNMIHSPKTNDVVKETTITTGYYADRYRGARRVVTATASSSNSSGSSGSTSSSGNSSSVSATAVLTKAGVVLISVFDECVADYTKSDLSGEEDYLKNVYLTGRKLGFDNGYSDSLDINEANAGLLYVRGASGKEAYLPKNVMFPTDIEYSEANELLSALNPEVAKDNPDLTDAVREVLAYPKGDQFYTSLWDRSTHGIIPKTAKAVTMYINFGKIVNQSKIDEDGNVDEKATKFSFYCVRNNAYVSDSNLVDWLKTDNAKSLTYVDAKGLLALIEGDFAGKLQHLTYEDWQKMQDIKDELQTNKDNWLVRVFNVMSIILGTILIILAILFVMAYWIDIFNTFSEVSILHLISMGNLYPVADDMTEDYLKRNMPKTKFVNFKQVLIIAGIMVIIGFLFLNTSQLISLIVKVFNYILYLIGRNG